MPQTSLVITSIGPVNGSLEELAKVANGQRWRFFLIGDAQSPADFHLSGCEFYSLDRQRALDLRYARVCPVRHYARKNIGYLVAWRDGAEVILETDDDNRPLAEFAQIAPRQVCAPMLRGAGWVNVYRYSSDLTIWPRGLPLVEIHRPLPELPTPALADCPIQQSLCDADPDVDAICRLIFGGHRPLADAPGSDQSHDHKGVAGTECAVHFRNRPAMALGAGSWCPINTQNTAWYRDAFPLLYLPACCNNRLTDIWRGLVAQRIAWAHGWAILFRGPSMVQARNTHDLMKDFADEVPLHLENPRIVELLERAKLAPEHAAIGDNLRVCYEALVSAGILDAGEMELLEAWLGDVATF